MKPIPMSKEMCPMGGKHELVYLRNIYAITCKKCGKTQFRHAKDILGDDYSIDNKRSSSKSEADG